MRRIFWFFCRNWFLIDPLHYLSSRSDFGFEFAEIFVIEKWLPWRAGESLWNLYSNFLKFFIKLQHFKRLNQHFKGPTLPKISLGCNVLTPLIDSKVWKHLYLYASILVDSPTRRVGESFFDYEYLREFEVKIGTARNVVWGTYAEPIYAKTPENPPRCHVPLTLFSGSF